MKSDRTPPRCNNDHLSAWLCVWLVIFAQAAVLGITYGASRLFTLSVHP